MAGNEIELKADSHCQKFLKLLYFSRDDYTDLNRLMKSLSEKDYHDVSNLWRLITTLREIYRASCENSPMKADLRLKNIRNFLAKYPKTLNFENAIYPLDTTKRIKCILIDDINILPSSSYPIQIKLILTNDEHKTILYKNNCDLTKDMFILKTAKFISSLCRQNICDYNVLPLGPTDGLVEMVKHMEIRLFALSFNYGSQQIPFVGSLSFFLAISYIFGIGDRHINNILMLESGDVMYIDFSFLLGTDPKYYYNFNIPLELKILINKHRLKDRVIDAVIEILNLIRLFHKNILEYMKTELEDKRYTIQHDKIEEYFLKQLKLKISHEMYFDIIRSKILAGFENRVSEVFHIITSVANYFRRL